MAYIDYYKILELTRVLHKMISKKAFRKLARKYHPDLNPNDLVQRISFRKSMKPMRY